MFNYHQNKQYGNQSGGFQNQGPRTGGAYPYQIPNVNLPTSTQGSGANSYADYYGGGQQGQGPGNSGFQNQGPRTGGAAGPGYQQGPGNRTAPPASPANYLDMVTELSGGMSSGGGGAPSENPYGPSFQGGGFQSQDLTMRQPTIDTGGFGNTTTPIGKIRQLRKRQNPYGGDGNNNMMDMMKMLMGGGGNIMDMMKMLMRGNQNY